MHNISSTWINCGSNLYAFEIAEEVICRPWRNVEGRRWRPTLENFDKYINLINHIAVLPPLLLTSIQSTRPIQPADLRGKFACFRLVSVADKWFCCVAVSELREVGACMIYCSLKDAVIKLVVGFRSFSCTNLKGFRCLIKSNEVILVSITALCPLLSSVLHQHNFHNTHSFSIAAPICNSSKIFAPKVANSTPLTTAISSNSFLHFTVAVTPVISSSDDDETTFVSSNHFWRWRQEVKDNQQQAH